MSEISDQKKQREHLIELLTLPRDMMRDKIDIPNCAHGGFYNALAQDCMNCINDEECSWLLSNDEFAVLNEKSTDKLLSALKYAIEFVQSQVVSWEHETNTCECKVCAWLGEAGQAIE